MAVPCVYRQITKSLCVEIASFVRTITEEQIELPTLQHKHVIEATEEFKL